MEWSELLYKNFNPIIDDQPIHNTEHAYTLFMKHFNTLDKPQIKLLNLYHDALKENNLELSNIIYNNYHDKINL